jgi:hypothetical protein
MQKALSATNVCVRVYINIYIYTYYVRTHVYTSNLIVERTKVIIRRTCLCCIVSHEMLVPGQVG